MCRGEKADKDGGHLQFGDEGPKIEFSALSSAHQVFPQWQDIQDGFPPRQPRPEKSDLDEKLEDPLKNGIQTEVQTVRFGQQREFSMLDLGEGPALSDPGLG